MTARRVIAAVAVAAALGAGLTVPPAAAVTAGEAEAQLVVAPRGGGIVAPGDPIDVDVEVRNTGSVPLSAGTLAFSLDQAPIASSAALLDAIAEPSAVLLGQLTEASAATPALEPGARARVRARITGADADTILTAASGARRLYVRLRTDRVQTVAESAVVRMRAGAPDIGFGTVVPLTAPAGSTGVVDTAQQAALTAPGGAWSDALAAAEALPTAVVALDPAVIASIRLAGEQAPESAQRFLADLAALGNEVAPLPYADTDVALARTAGAPRSLAPASFDGVATAAPAAGTATPEPTATPPATAAELIAWDWTAPPLSWPVPGTATAPDLLATGGDGVALLGAADLQDTPARAAAGPAALVGDARVLVADQAASRLLAGATTEGIAGDAALAALVGALATDAVTGATPAVLAVAGRGASSRGLARVLGLLDDQGWIRGETARTMTSGLPTAVALRSDTGVPTERTTTARRVVDGERVVQRLGTAVPDPDALTTAPRLALLALLSAQWRADDAGWTAAAATTATASAAYADRVFIVDSGAALASGVDGTLAVNVQNDLPQEVTVEVQAQVSNGRLQFTSEEPTPVTVPAQTIGQVGLAFRSIANGPAVITLRLTTPDGRQIGDAVPRPVSVSAGFDTIVAVVLLTLLALLLALGVYRNVKRRRRPREAR